MNLNIINKKFYVYIVKCSDGTFYTGSTIDLDKRVYAHNNLKSGAKYTAMRRPVTLVYSEEMTDSTEMRRRECKVKSMKREDKLKLIVC